MKVAFPAASTALKDIDTMLSIRNVNKSFVQLAIPSTLSLKGAKNNNKCVLKGFSITKI